MAVDLEIVLAQGSKEHARREASEPRSQFIIICISIYIVFNLDNNPFTRVLIRVILYTSGCTIVLSRMFPNHGQVFCLSRLL